MKIFVDADACPTIIKDILVRAAIRLSLPIIFIANKPIKLPLSELVSMIIVEQGPDVADNKIVELAKKGDLIISEDVPLADQIINKGAYVISTRGTLLTKENIKQRLATRNLLDDLRNAGISTGGPTAYNHKDTRTFSNQLDRFLTKHA